MKETNYTAIFIEYYLQHREYGADSEATLEKTLDFMSGFKDEIPQSDYPIIENLLQRITNISK